MKRRTPSFWLTITAGFALMLFGGCKPSESSTDTSNPGSSKPSSLAPTIASAEKNSFQDVASHLDAGGDFYLYLSTEQWLKGISDKLASLRQLSEVIPDMKDDDRQNLGKVVDVVTHVIKDSGIEDISGFGMSSIAREKGMYQTKVMLHHYKGQGTGFVWSLFGAKPHALEGLNLLPANTAFAAFSDLDAAGLWNLIKKEVSQAGIPPAEEALNKLPAAFEAATGLKWETVVGSLGGEFGFVLTLDDTKTLTIPLPMPEPLEIAEPGLMLVAKVKDDTIFNRVDQALRESGQQVTKVDKTDLKMRTVAIPLPLPVPLRPTLASSGGYLFIATTDSMIEEALAVKSGKKQGLKSTPEYQRVAKGVPQEGNAFSYLSPRVAKLFRSVQKQAMTFAIQTQPAQQQFFESFMAASTNANFSYHVSANTDEGWISVGNGNQNASKLMLIGAAVPVGVLAGVALPALAKAKAAAAAHAHKE